MVFYAVFVLGTFAVTYFALNHPTTVKYHEGELIPVIKCIGITDARTLTIYRDGRTNTIHLIGVDLPSDATTRFGADVDIAREDEIALHALQAWIYKKRLQIFAADETQPPEDATEYKGYASLYGVDIGRKLIKEGQAFVRDVEHPRRADYETLEAAAREARKGIWRHEVSP